MTLGQLPLGSLVGNEDQTRFRKISAHEFEIVGGTTNEEWAPLGSIHYFSLDKEVELMENGVWFLD